MENLTINSSQLLEKWGPVINHEGLPEIKDAYKRQVTAILLENQEKAIQEQMIVEGTSSTGLLAEFNDTGSTTAGVAGLGVDGPASTSTAPGRRGYDPILISMVRRATPQLIAYDIVGTQPMKGPTGLVFYMKSNYVAQNSSQANVLGNEALHGEAATQFSGRGSGANAGDAEGSGDDGTSDASVDPFEDSYYGTPAIDATGYGDSQDTGTGMTTSTAEELGGAVASQFREMTFSIDKTSVTARSRALKAEYTTELVQDLKAVHGLDAEKELSNILSTEILQEINREVVRTVNGVAVKGAATTASPGVFDCDVDASGRWSVEKFKGLHFQLEREANAIAVDTRRGRGNIIVCSADVAAALSMTGTLDTGAAEQLAADGLVNNTFVGTLNGKFKVYVDPYFTAGTQSGYVSGVDLAGKHDYITVGYKGASPYDAGIFYCPYVPLQQVKAVGEDTFQPKIGFKTRYGMLANPYQDSGNQLVMNSNKYYRIVAVTNIL